MSGPNVCVVSDLTSDDVFLNTSVTAPVDQYSEVTFGAVTSTANNAGYGPAVRIVSGQNSFYRVVGSGAGWELQRSLSGVHKMLANNSTTTFAAGDRLRIQAQGAVLTLFKNGTSFFTINDANIPNGSWGIAYSSVDGPGASISLWTAGSVAPIQGQPSVVLQQLVIGMSVNNPLGLYAGTVPITPVGSNQATNLLTYLNSLTGTGKLLIGQYTDYIASAGQTMDQIPQIYSGNAHYPGGAGVHPAILGTFMCLEQASSLDDVVTISNNWLDLGGIVLTMISPGNPSVNVANGFPILAANGFGGPTQGPGQPQGNPINWSNLVTPGQPEYIAWGPFMDQLVAKFKAMAPHGPVIARMFPEMNRSQQWYSKGYNTPSQFISLWQRTVTYCRSQGVNNVLWCFNLGGSSYVSGDVANFYPGDAYVDVVSLDRYPPNSNDINCINEYVSVCPTKPIIYAEFGENGAVPRTAYEGDTSTGLLTIMNGAGNFNKIVAAVVWGGTIALPVQNGMLTVMQNPNVITLEDLNGTLPAPTSGVLNGPAPRFWFVDSSPNNSDGSSPQYSQARADVVCMADLLEIGCYEGVGSECYDNGTGTNTMNNYITYAKSQSVPSSNLKAMLYHDPEGGKIGGSSGIPDWINISYVTNNWPLRDAGGGVVAGFQGIDTINTTNYVRPDTATGLSCCPRGAKWFADRFYFGTAGGSGQSQDGPTPALDGWFRDNCFTCVPCSGVWRAGSGVTDSSSNTALNAVYRAGIASGANWLTNNVPGPDNGKTFIIANIATWNVPGATNGAAHDPQNGGTITGYDNLFFGGILEGMMGLTYGQDYYSDFAHIKAQYQFCVQHTTSGGRGVSIHCNWDGNGLDAVNRSTPWQGPRYQLAFVHMDEGCAVMSQAISTYSDANYNSYNFTRAGCWPDELMVNVSTKTMMTTYTAAHTNRMTCKGWLGTAMDAPWTTHQSTSGATLYARRFTDGTNTFVVVCNPKGNNGQTMDFVAIYGKQLQRFNGRTVNGGQKTNTYTFSDRDGIFGMLV